MTDVSIIIPFCKRGRQLDRAVRSVEKALAAAPEITGEILPIDDSERHGVSWARNRGLEKAAGEWIVFVDADDELAEGFFTDVLLPHRQDTGCELITCGYETVTDRDEDIVCVEPETASLTGYGFIEERLLGGRDVHVWAKAFRRTALFSAAPEPDGVDGAREKGDAVPMRFQEGLTIGEDMLFLADFALHAGKRRCILATSETGYRYRINPAGAMEKPYDPSFLDELRCWEQLEERLAPVRRALTPYAYAALGGIRVRSAMMVAVRIARLPAERRDEQENRDAFKRTRGIVREMLHRNGVFAGLAGRDKVRALLLRWFPRRFLSMAARSVPSHRIE